MQTTFIDKMYKHWTQTLGLAGSKALTEGWQQLEQATSRISTGATHWQVLQLPTGSGKTEALKILCSVQDSISHPGILIVTKFTEEADKIATDINKFAGWPMAVSVHSNAPALGIEPARYRVLVVTHSAYTLALLELADGMQSTKWDRLHTYECGKRAWVFIDEQFNWVDTYSLNIGSLRAMTGDFSGALPNELRRTAQQLQRWVLTLTDRHEHHSPDRPLTEDQLDSLKRINLDGLQIVVEGIPADTFANWVDVDQEADTEQGQSSAKHSRSSKEQYLNLLKELHSLTRIGHGWLSQRGDRVLLHTSRTLLGIDGLRGIILDATAEVDPSYTLTQDKITILPRPAGIRNYKNVTLHVSNGHRVGKTYLKESAAKEWPVVWGNLAVALDQKPTLVCGHKDVLPTIRQFTSNNKLVSLANWGKLDGKNEWNKCEYAVLFGLPYLDDISPVQTFIAHRGPQPTDWFEGNRAHGAHTNICNALRDGFIARSVIQALNRTRCRNIIDTEGNCAPTDLYILLPNRITGQCVVSAIKQQMPGIRIKDWDVGAAKRKARKVPTETMLVTHFECATSDVYLKSDLVRTLRINVSSLERMTAKLRDASSSLAQKLGALGVQYYSQTGRGKEAYFIKQ